MGDTTMLNVENTMKLANPVVVVVVVAFFKIDFGRYS
jgi:hypothetical protein